MKRNINPDNILFSTAFLIGATSVGWTCIIFMDTNILALFITLVIGCVYGIGAAELFQFRKATATLTESLLNTKGKVAVLEEWINRLHVTLRHSVRNRIQGDRVGLPAPILTPYFVGLLVMLGLLGTFVGMVYTLKGAVIALEGTTELEAIRAGLAAPIKGLGLAFGTSIAGVATSAMLGLMSTLSRRDRMRVTRRLDNSISLFFKDFSLVHSQQETFSALRTQSRALPEVSERLHFISDKLEQVGNTLIRHQDRFHESVERTFSDLAVSIDQTHKASLKENARLASESIKPVAADAMSTVVAETRMTHQHLLQTSREYLNALSGRLSDTSAQMAESVSAALADQHQSNDLFIQQMRSTLHEFENRLDQMAASMGESFTTITAAVLEHQKTSDEDRLARWTSALENTQIQSARNFSDASDAFSAELKLLADLHRETFQSARNDLLSLSEVLSSQWQQLGKDALEQQNNIANAIKDTMNAISLDLQSTSSRLQDQFSELLVSSENLIHTRINSENAWLDSHRQRMEDLSQMMKSELTMLRNDEEQRGKAAVDHLAHLESVLAVHITSIGKALEAPMARLIQTAEQAPIAAADVIEHLRREALQHTKQETLQLEEQKRIITEIETLSRAVARTSFDQQTTIEQLVQQSGGMLEDTVNQFKNRISTEAGKFSEISQTFASSALEMASLGDAFGTAINLFRDSNEQLMENLSRIEESLEQAALRNDEQLGYYVAQAREIIDHCMLSQKEIFEDLQKLRQNTDITLTG